MKNTTQSTASACRKRENTQGGEGALSAAPEFIWGFALAAGIDTPEARHEWGRFSRDLSDRERLEKERQGWDSGSEEGTKWRKTKKTDYDFEKAGSEARAILRGERITELRRAVKYGLPHEIYDAIVDFGRETVETYEKCEDDNYVMSLAVEILREEGEHV